MGKTRKGLRYEAKDKFFFEAKKAGFVARSALKLEEIDARFHLYKPAMKVLDLGCAPGSWLQYAARKVGPKGRLWGIDLDPVRIAIPRVTTVQGDILGLEVNSDNLASLVPFDFIQSDAMTKTTGIAESDCARSVALAEHAMRLARAGALRVGGTVLIKVFEGPGFTEFYVSFKPQFHWTHVLRPEASRKGSREVYVLGLDYKGTARLKA